MVRAVFGMTMISHAANFMLLASGVSAWRGEPIDGRTDVTLAADPLPQAFVLTAIVITLAVTVFMLSLAVVSRDDDTHQIPDTGQGPLVGSGPAGAEPTDAQTSATPSRTVTGQEHEA